MTDSHRSLAVTLIQAPYIPPLPHMHSAAYRSHPQVGREDHNAAGQADIKDKDLGARQQ